MKHKTVLFSFVVAIFIFLTLRKFQVVFNIRKETSTLSTPYKRTTTFRTRKYSNIKPVDCDIPERFFGTSDVSLHEYSWVINADSLCKNKSVFLLVAVASAVWEFERRHIIRETWASIKSAYNVTIVYVFFVGNNFDSHLNEKLKNEMKMYGDLVQGNYLESYRNLTIKTQGQLKWITTFCHNAKFAIHVDDDVVANIRKIVEEILKKPLQRTLMCAKVFKALVRREGKWKTSVEDYSSTNYPLACVGWCFVMSLDVVKDLYYMSLDTVLFHLEDVYTTGILREKIGNLKLAKFEGGEMLCQHKGWPKDRPVNDKIKETWIDMNTNS